MMLGSMLGSGRIRIFFCAALLPPSARHPGAGGDSRDLSEAWDGDDTNPATWLPYQFASDIAFALTPPSNQYEGALFLGTAMAILCKQRVPLVALLQIVGRTEGGDLARRRARPIKRLHCASRSQRDPERDASGEVSGEHQVDTSGGARGVDIKHGKNNRTRGDSGPAAIFRRSPTSHVCARRRGSGPKYGQCSHYRRAGGDCSPDGKKTASDQRAGGRLFWGHKGVNLSEGGGGGGASTRQTAHFRRFAVGLLVSSCQELHASLLLSDLQETPQAH